MSAADSQIGPDRSPPWEVCQVGAAKPAGFRLYHHVIASVAGSYLHVLGFDPARAADPAAPGRRLVVTLLRSTNDQ